MRRTESTLYTNSYVLMKIPTDDTVPILGTANKKKTKNKHRNFTQVNIYRYTYIDSHRC